MKLEDKFQKKTEAEALWYLINGIQYWEDKPTPVNIKSFLIEQAVKYSPQFEEEAHKKILLSTLADLPSYWIH